MADLKTKTSVFALIVLTAGLVGALSVFLTWFGFDFFPVDDLGYATFSPIVNRGYSGWEMFRMAYDYSSLSDIGETYPFYMPLAMLMLSIGGLLSGLLAIMRPGRLGGAGAAVCGAGALIAAVVYIWYISDGVSMEWVGAGAYIAVAAGIAMLAFGALAAYPSAAAADGPI
ncbi:MAG: hypothetical protein FWH47_04315 [Methanomassiliicoccaceae archaeon]|nr:hypothetical protein [Methanomassiliicoccaceae archaeon]